MKPKAKKAKHAKAVKPVWKESGGPASNEILDCNGFFVSYLPAGAQVGGGMFPFLGSMFASDDGEAETALCIDEGGKTKYLILNGDYRHEYEKLAPKGLKACLAFYEKKKGDARSSWSDDDRSH